jgi:hypothetical protein
MKKKNFILYVKGMVLVKTFILYFLKELDPFIKRYDGKHYTIRLINEFNNSPRSRTSCFTCELYKEDANNPTRFFLKPAPDYKWIPDSVINSAYLGCITRYSAESEKRCLVVDGRLSYDNFRYIAKEKEDMIHEILNRINDYLAAHDETMDLYQKLMAALPFEVRNLHPFRAKIKENV